MVPPSANWFTQRIWPQHMIALLCVFACVLVSGCETAEEVPAEEPATQEAEISEEGRILDANGQPLPRLNEIASDLEASRPGPQPMDEQDNVLGEALVRVKPATLSIFRIDLPLDTPTDDAWAMVDPTTISRAVRASWGLNGMRVGTLSQGEVGKFIMALKNVVGSRKQHMRLAGLPTPMQTSPQLVRPVRVDLTVPPFAVKQQAVLDGKLRLLASVNRDELDRVWLDLLPQHHVPENALLPRNPMEQQFDGTLFHELKLRGPAWPGTVLVLGLGPDPVAPLPTEDGTEQTPEDPEQPEIDPEDVALLKALNRDPSPDPLLRRDMGAQLFGARRFHKPIKVVLLITTVQTQ